MKTISQGKSSTWRMIKTLIILLGIIKEITCTSICRTDAQERMHKYQFIMMAFTYHLLGTY
jgi:hypothetical protein